MIRQQRATLSIGWYFFHLGAAVGNFAAILPYIMLIHDLSTATLGAILVSAIFGAIIGAPTGATINEKYGTGFCVVVGSLALVFLYIIIGLPQHVAILVVGIACLGFSMAVVDVSMNGQAILCEKLGGKSTMGLFHSLYAVGGLVGVLFGGGLIEAGFEPYQELGIFSAAVLLPFLFFSFDCFSQSEEKAIEKKSAEGSSCRKLKAASSSLTSCSQRDIAGIADVVEEEEVKVILSEVRVISSQEDLEQQRQSSDTGTPEPSTDMLTTASIKLEGGNNNEMENTEDSGSKITINYIEVIVLCSIGGLAYLGEGSIGDWSAIYLVINLGSDPVVGSLGFAAFQLAVAIGRYFLDSLVENHGVDRRILLKLAGVFSFLGLGLVTLAPSLPHPIPATIIGFGIAGMGLSFVAPIVMYLAGSTIEGMKPAEAIATVASCAYIGVLIGPPLIGGLAEACGDLRWSLLIDGGLMLAISVLAFWVVSTTTASLSTESTLEHNDGNRKDAPAEVP